MTAPRVDSLRVIVGVDDDPDVSWLEGDRCDNDDDRAADRERLEAFNRGDWWMVGIRVRATIVVNGVLQRIESGGLWGVESDARDYWKEVACEEYAALVDTLAALGITDVPPLSDAEWSDG